MTYMGKIFLPVVVALCLLPLSAFGDCPNFEKVRKSYGEKPYVTVDFRQLTHSDLFASTDTVAGKIWAGWGGRFRLSLPHQLLVSNGTLFWSYSDENKQVLIDSVARRGKWNPLVLLYDPQRLYSCKGEKKSAGRIEFDLTANDTLTAPRSFQLQVVPDGFVPQRVSYGDDNDSQVEVYITDFARKAALPDSLFEFHAPKGVEVILVP